jgi:ketosteroid isomerase-like protein
VTNYDEIARRYIEAWNEADPNTRRAKVNELYTPDARYIDPLAKAEGRDAIEATIAAVQQQFPGFATGRIQTVLGFLDKVPAAAG